MPISTETWYRFLPHKCLPCLIVIDVGGTIVNSEKEVTNATIVVTTEDRLAKGFKLRGMKGPQSDLVSDKWISSS